MLKLLGIGTLLTIGFLMPGPAYLVVKAYEEEKRRKEFEEWEKFNPWRLRQVIKRLEQQKVVEIIDGVVKVTEKGKQRLLKFNIEEMELKRKRDGKWRIIIYDIANLKKTQREYFRLILKRLKFFPIQKSVYLTPFVCDDEIEYLRQVFDIGNDVIVLKVYGFENDQVYKKYFGIN